MKRLVWYYLKFSRHHHHHHLHHHVSVMELGHLLARSGLTYPEVSSMAFKGRDPVRTKIVIDSRIMEQINSFNYLGNIISYERELDIDGKLNDYL